MRLLKTVERKLRGFESHSLRSSVVVFTTGVLDAGRCTARPSGRSDEGSRRSNPPRQRACYAHPMASTGPFAISVDDGLSALKFLPDRTPATSADESKDSFKLHSTYREGGIFVGYWAGKSEWERHVAGDEIVMVLEGETTIYFFTDDGEAPAALRRSEFTIVPQGTWHRFETSHSVRWESAPDRRILSACRASRSTSPTTSTKS